MRGAMVNKEQQAGRAVCYMELCVAIVFMLMGGYLSSEAMVMCGLAIIPGALTVGYVFGGIRITGKTKSKGPQ